MSSREHPSLPTPPSSRRQILAADGTPLEYFTCGTSGPVLVYVNALGLDLLIFARLIEHLAREHRVIACRLRDTSGMTVADHVRDLQRVLTAESVDECSLIAWCSGAKIALELARRMPIARALILVNGAYHLAGEPGSIFEQTMFEICKSVLEDPTIASFAIETLKKVLLEEPKRAALRGSDHATPAALRSFIAEPFQSLERALRYAQQVVDHASFDIRPTLLAIDVPVLVIAGESDRISPSAIAHDFARQLRRGGFMQIPNGSHYCMYEESTTVAELIEEFLSSATYVVPSPEAALSITRETR
jgi:pimeloyl-ACP methyl ester carboxylesterase